MSASDPQRDSGRDSPRTSTGTGSQIRYLRSIGLPNAIALGSSITVGAGVYILLGQLLKFSDATTAALAYLLALIAVLPIILTAAERVAYLPVRDGIYGLSRQGSLLSIPYFTGWLMFGGLACLAGVLGWGTAVYADLLLRMFAQEQLPPMPWLAALVTAAGMGLMLLWGRSHWQRYTALILAGVAFIALLASRGYLTLDPMFGAPRSSTVDLLDVTVMITASFWGVHFVLNVRNEMHRPTRNVTRALLVNAGLRTLLGMAAAVALLWYPGDPLTTNAPLNDIAQIHGLGTGAIWQVGYGLFGVMISMYALRQTVERAKDLTAALRRDGYLPQSGVLPGILSRIDLALLMFWAMAVAGVALLATDHLIELAAVGFLFSMALAFLPSLRSRQPDLPQNRRLKLPFHPLFPGLSVATGVLLGLLTIDTVGLFWLGWIAIGLVAYWLNGHSRAVAARRETVVVEDVSGPHSDADDIVPPYRVMVSVDKPADVPNLVHSAALLAQTHHGEVIVLKVLSMPNYVSDTVERRMADGELKSLQELVDSAMEEKGAVEGVKISPMVRLASTLSSGILDTATEENASLLLAGWRGEVVEERRTPDPLLNDLVRYAPCPVTILRGVMPDTLGRLVVFTAGGPNSAAALPVAETLADPHVAAIELVTVNSGMEENEAQDYLYETLAKAAEPERFEAHLVDAGSIDAGVATASTDADFVFFGVSKEDVSARSYFGGLAAELAYNCEKPSMLVRGFEHIRYLGVQRMMDSMRYALPNLTDQERSAVAQKMREDAVPSVDFFVLIVLASAIATLGLLQNSTAVIIGAMLVAPLMSPILATGMAIVMGETYTLRIAAEATAKGVAVAILVGIVMTMLSPFTEPTTEIMARTAPTVLDLMVALTSGAAAGYAVCRKEVAAALPGVAISAALVPPLCVVGYGIGTSQFDIATGSLLLFATNLVAIVVAGAIVFLALGFHPPRSEREEFRRNLWVSALSLGAVFIVLMIATLFTVRDANARLAVEEVFRQDMVANAAVIDKLDVDRRGGRYFVEATVFAYQDGQLSSQEMDRLQADLSKAVGGPVDVDLTVISASGSDLIGTADLRMLEEYLEAESSKADVSLAELVTEQRESDVYVFATLVSYPESTLSQSLLNIWQGELTDIAKQPVVLEVSVIEGQRGSYAPTATPESSIVATSTPAP